MAILIAAALLAAPAFTPVERPAAARAAGFGVQGSRIINECDVTAGQIGFERHDLDGDDVAETIVSDGGGCHGNGGSMFVVRKRNRRGRLAPVLSAQGVMVVRETRHGGWTDSEIGGSGFG